MTAAITSQLSPGFHRARSLSRVLAVLLGIGFWFTTIVGAALIGTVLLARTFLPADAAFAFNSPPFYISSLSLVGNLGIVLSLLLRFGPSAAALYFGRRVFVGFAKGAVFASATIADIRATSLSMVAVALATSIDQFVFNLSIGRMGGATFNPEILFFGLCAYVCAYVMAEARRLADDNASIV